MRETILEVSRSRRGVADDPLANPVHLRMHEIVSGIRISQLDITIIKSGIESDSTLR